MATNNNYTYAPAAVDTATPPPTPIAPLDRTPAPVEPGPGLGITASTTPAVVPVQEVAVNPAGANAVTNVKPTVPNYIEVLLDGNIIVKDATAINFTGSGVAVTANGAVATMTITSGGTYGNSNVSTLLAGFGSNTITTTGNVTAGYLFGNGSQLTGLAATYGNSNVTTLLASLGANTISGTGNITTTANISGGFILGNGSQLTGIVSSYGNANVVANLAALGSNPISTTGNITGGNILGGANVNATTHTGTTVSVSANVTGGNITTAGIVSAAGNVSGGNVIAATLVQSSTVSASANITGGNILTGGLISATGNITSNNLIISSGIVGSGASPAPSLSGFSTISTTGAPGNISASGNLLAGGYVSATGNVTANNISLTGNGFVTFTSGSSLTFGDTPVTNRYYIDATRTDTYTQNGSQARPFKTIAAAQAAIATAISGGLNPEVEPIYMILLSNITENVTLATNHVYLVGQSGQIHQPIILTGNITVQPTSGTLTSNHFSLTGIEVVGGTNGKAIYVTGTSPTRLSLQDVWITANGNSGAGLYQDNSGTGTYTHGGPVKVSHNGTGNVYCFDIRAGTASFDTVETSGATQVGASAPGATMTFNNSQLEANGNTVLETYGNGVVVVTNSVIKNSAANSYGIKLNAVANVAGTVSVGQSAFNVPLGTGQAVWLDPNTTPGLSGVFAWGGASFYPNTNTTISANVIPGPLATLVGTQISPIFYGDITSYAVAQDWDLIDNNASALSFDTTGKAGVLELVTTNSAEGVKMSGFASATGNVTGGNLLTAGLISATGNITGGNILGGANVNATLLSGTTASLSGNVTGGNILTGGLISATGNITGGNILGGANVNATTHTGTTASLSGNVTGGNILTGGLISATGNITGGNLTISGNTATITSANLQIGYLEIPQISLAANVTANLTVSGKHYYTTSASNLALTLADNSTVSWPVGTAISVINRGTANVTVAPAAGVSLYLAGNSTSANRVVTTYGMATVMNVAANVWMINGTVV